MALTKPSENRTGNQQLTFLDLVKRLDPKGNVAFIGEVLNETNEILQDIVMREGNLPNGHEDTIRNGLPEVYWRQYNRGVPPSKSTTATITETCGMMQARSQVDEKLLELNGNTREYRNSEDKAFIEAMNQTMANTLFYGDAKKKEEGFSGLATRYSTLKADVPNSKNVIDCGGTGNNLTSVWLVGWGQDTVFGIYPKGTPVGLKVRDLGLQQIEDDQGNYYSGYVTTYNWDMGLMVKDWRYVVRLANINVDDLINGKGIGTVDITKADSSNLLLKMQRAMQLIPSGTNRRLAFYMNNDVQSGINTLATRMNSPIIRVQEAINGYGQNMMYTSFLNIPIRQVDQLKNNEKQVTR